MDSYRTLDPADQRTLRLAPLWLVSSLLGSARLDVFELDAFWNSVHAAVPSTTGLGNEVLRALQDDPGVLAAYEQDARPIVTGLLEAAGVASGFGLDAARSLRSAVVSVGEGFARARGPFGRSISQQDADTLELMSEVMNVEDANPRRLFASS